LKYEIKKRKDFQFFVVSDKYINYLKEYENKVCDNYGEKRTHIGIVIEINNIKYVAPLTSNDKDYLLFNKKLSRLVHPIENGKLGFIRIANMIPVPISELTPIFLRDVNDSKYKDILHSQYLFLKKEVNHTSIMKMAYKIYDIRCNFHNHYLHSDICNFKLLENLCNKWNSNY